MKKVVISVLGQDRPGIIARVSRALLLMDCNIENVSQTILQSEFSGIFIAATPDALSGEDLKDFLEKETAAIGLHIYVKEFHKTDGGSPVRSEPFVICTQGPDRKGLVAAVTGVIASYHVNVTHLQAVFQGGDDPEKNIMIYEVDVPVETDKKSLDAALRETAKRLGLDITIQHRNIFEAIHRI